MKNRPARPLSGACKKNAFLVPFNTERVREQTSSTRPSFNCRLLQVPACIDWSNCSLTHVRTHQLDGNSASSADKGAVHLIAAPCRRAQSEHLKLGVAGRTRKGDHVANVLHAGEVEEHAFEAKTEAS